MKKYWAVMTLAGVMAGSNLYASYDGSMTLAQGPYSYGNGGEFTAVTTGLGTFQTFCIEYNEEFVPGGTYDYNMNSGAVAGGAGTDAIDSHTGLAMDNVSLGTAWLYSQFRAGTLTLDTGVGTYFNANRQLNAGELQQAIWFLEDEVGGVNNGYVTLVENKLGKTLAQIEADSDGAYGVIALNLFNGPAATQVTKNGVTYNLNQDQLAIVPEPATVLAGALLLLPLGASSIRILRRKPTV